VGQADALDDEPEYGRELKGCDRDPGEKTNPPQHASSLDRRLPEGSLEATRLLPPGTGALPGLHHSDFIRSG